MGEYLNSVPEKIQDHIKSITKTSGLPDSEESTELIAKGWLEKMETFEEKLDELNMEEIDSLNADDEQGALILTYSGSLLNIGPIINDSRKVQYASIGLRQDVPETAEKDGSELADDFSIDDSVSFNIGPIKSSSPVYKIAVCKGELEPEEQEEAINQATMILTEEFVEVNKTMILED